MPARRRARRAADPRLANGQCGHVPRVARGRSGPAPTVTPGHRGATARSSRARAVVAVIARSGPGRPRAASARSGHAPLKAEIARSAPAPTVIQGRRGATGRSSRATAVVANVPSGRGRPRVANVRSGPGPMVTRGRRGATDRSSRARAVVAATARLSRVRPRVASGRSGRALLKAGSARSGPGPTVMPGRRGVTGRSSRARAAATVRSGRGRPRVASGLSGRGRRRVATVRFGPARLTAASGRSGVGPRRATGRPGRAAATHRVRRRAARRQRPLPRMQTRASASPR